MISGIYYGNKLKLSENIFSREVSHVAKQQKIRTVSYVHIGDKLVNTDELDDDQRRRLATWLKTTYLNTLVQGKAVFHEIDHDKISSVEQ